MIRALLVVGILFCSLFVLTAQNIAEVSNLTTPPPHKDYSYGFLKVFPNPIGDYFQITENKVVKKILVYSLVGKKVKAFEYVPGERFYLGDIRKGIYLVQFTDLNNKILTTKRVSKK